MRDDQTTDRGDCDDRGTSQASRRRDDDFRKQRSQPGKPGSHFRREGPKPEAVIDGKGLLGKIAKIVAEKGFGFIDGDNGVRYFFHRSAVLPNDGHYANLYEGQPVTFDGIKSHKGPRCEQLQAVEPTRGQATTR